MINDRFKPLIIQLRNIVQADLPTLFEFQVDLEANQMAFTHPRSNDDFDAHWVNAVQDPNVVAKAIVADEEFVGCISCFKSDGLDSIGYWIDRDFWGKGVATRALQLLLAEVSIRPLHARVAVTNFGSIRVLEKCGFTILRHEWSPATGRYIECEEAIFELT